MERKPEKVNRVLGKTKEGHPIMLHAKTDGLSPESLKEAADFHRKRGSDAATFSADAKKIGQNLVSKGFKMASDHHEAQAQAYEGALKKSSGIPEPKKAPIKEPSVPSVNKPPKIKQTISRVPRFIKLSTPKV